MMLDDVDILRKRFLYRSWHRGMQEMDLVLGSFATKHLGSFEAKALEEYRQILETPDPELYDWITGRVAPPANRVTPVLELLLAHRLGSVKL